MVPLSLTSADGNSYEYDQPFGLSGLSQEVEYSGQVSTPSVQIGCIFPGQPCHRMAAGENPRDWGQLPSQWCSKIQFLERYHRHMRASFFWVQGQISQPQIAFPDQPTGATSFSVVLYMGASGGNSLLDNDWVIDGTTFASADIADNALDKAYPLVIGQPGVRYDNTGTEIKFEGSPAYMYDDTHTAPLLLITADLSYASQVTIIDNVGNSALLNISYKQDLQGNRYSYVDINGSAVETLQSTEWFFAPGLMGEAYRTLMALAR
jgi:hypothetical protein